MLRQLIPNFISFFSKDKYILPLIFHYNLLISYCITYDIYVLLMTSSYTILVLNMVYRNEWHRKSSYVHYLQIFA